MPRVLEAEWADHRGWAEGVGPLPPSTGGCRPLPDLIVIPAFRKENAEPLGLLSEKPCSGRREVWSRAGGCAERAAAGDPPCLPGPPARRQGVVYTSRVRVKAFYSQARMHNPRPRKAICQLACAENSKRASRGLPALWRENQGKGSAGDHGCFSVPLSSLTVAEVREGAVAHVCPQRGAG